MDPLKEIKMKDESFRHRIYIHFEALLFPILVRLVLRVIRILPNMWLRRFCQ